MSIKLKTKILSELDSIQYVYDVNSVIAIYDSVTYSSDDFKEMSHNATTKGIYNYILEEKINFESIFHTTTGVTIVGGIPSPYVDTVKVTIVIPTQQQLKEYMHCSIDNSDRSVNGVKLFNAINSWINLLWPITIITGTVINPIIGNGTITFPIMASLGEIYNNEINAKKPNKKEESIEILSKYIVQGLNTNLIAPIPTTGTAAGNPYTGMTVPIFVFT